MRRQQQHEEEEEDAAAAERRRRRRCGGNSNRKNKKTVRRQQQQHEEEEDAAAAAAGRRKQQPADAQPANLRARAQMSVLLRADAAHPAVAEVVKPQSAARSKREARSGKHEHPKQQQESR